MSDFLTRLTSSAAQSAPIMPVALNSAYLLPGQYSATSPPDYPAQAPVDREQPPSVLQLLRMTESASAIEQPQPIKEKMQITAEENKEELSANNAIPVVTAKAEVRQPAKDFPAPTAVSPLADKKDKPQMTHTRDAISALPTAHPEQQETGDRTEAIKQDKLSISPLPQAVPAAQVRPFSAPTRTLIADKKQTNVLEAQAAEKAGKNDDISSAPRPDSQSLALASARINPRLATSPSPREALSKAQALAQEEKALKLAVPEHAAVRAKAALTVGQEFSPLRTNAQPATAHTARHGIAHAQSPDVLSSAANPLKPSIESMSVQVALNPNPPPIKPLTVKRSQAEKEPQPLSPAREISVQAALSPNSPPIKPPTVKRSQAEKEPQPLSPAREMSVQAALNPNPPPIKPLTAKRSRAEKEPQRLSPAREAPLSAHQSRPLPTRPTINITIGRLELKGQPTKTPASAAKTPPVRTARAPTRSSRLQLKDYLHSSTGT